jgi:hypothetical protein
MTCTTYTRCARTASTVGRAGKAGTASLQASQANALALVARAQERKISFAELVSAQARLGGAQ